MNTGIGAPGAEQGHGFARKLFNGVLNRLLNAQSIVLALPSDEIDAVIFDKNFIANHSFI